ncbi:MAG: hypothetical protein KGH75_01265 [Rhodospirillales bacterium]|nr:hypothetical protein [Rhodospirillales bacterium]
MDTHIAEPTLDDVQSYQARLPGEPETDRQNGGDEPLRAGERPAAVPKGHRKSGLLSGVAIIAVAVIATGGFLVSPYNTVVPVPPALKLQVAQLFHGHAGPTQPQIAATSTKPTLPKTHLPPAPSQTAAAVPPAAQQGAHLDVLAPAASLAAEKPQAALPPVKQAPYVPPPPQDEVAELEGFQSGHAVSGTAAAPTAQTAPHKSAALAQPAAKPVQVATQADVVPPGYVPHEPGVSGQSGIVTTHPTTPDAAKPAPAPHPASVVPVVAKPEPTSTQKTEPTVVKVKPASIATPTAALAAAAKLEAAPMSPPDQVQVLELVTQLATLVRDERTQISNLQADQQNAQKAEGAKLSDFERRLALVEASQAMASASDVPASSDTLSAPPVSPTAVALTSARAALKAASQPPQAPAPAPAVAPTPAQPVTPEIYHVQAASPGLAMLAEVDHSGGDGAQIQVQVGDTIPGYGHVLSVTQRGTNWIVQTDHGLIQ